MLGKFSSLIEITRTQSIGIVLGAWVKDNDENVLATSQANFLLSIEFTAFRRIHKLN